MQWRNVNRSLILTTLLACKDILHIALAYTSSAPLGTVNQYYCHHLFQCSELRAMYLSAVQLMQSLH